VPLDPAKGDAEEMARLLRRLMENGDGEVEVITVEELLKRYDEKPAAPSAPAPAAGAQGALWPPPLPARLAFVTLAFASPLQAQPGAAAADAAQQADAKEQSGVTVAVDKETNSLLLLGSPREIERAMRLIEQASKSLPAEGSRIRAIQLPASADPTSLASVVVGTIARMTPPGGAVGDLAKRVAVIADPERRALLVVASDRDFETVGQLVATLARGQQTEQVVVKSYVLRNAGAQRVAESLRAVASDGAGSRLRSLAVTILDAGEPAAGDPDAPVAPGDSLGAGLEAGWAASVASGGGGSVSTTTTVAGGAGKAGAIIVEEYR
jgi:type II secretory pathway component GspD/PulD (secretin)